MDFIKRILLNIKWCIFNHPPTSIIEDIDPDSKCDYCGSKTLLWSRTLDDKKVYTICANCEKDVFDSVLTGSNS